MPNTHPKHAWKMREVEQLIGMPRRDIQRACYEGEGGVGLLSPENSTWGRRTYGCEDLATLFVANELRRTGLSLPEVKREFDKAAAQGADSLAMLANWVHRLREQEEELRGRLLKAEALLAELCDAGSEKDGVEALAERHIARCTMDELPLGCVGEAWQTVAACLHELRRCLEHGDAPGSEAAQAAVLLCEQACSKTTGDVQATRKLIVKLLNDPGMDLVVELWLGSGTYTYAEQTWAKYTNRKDERHGA